MIWILWGMVLAGVMLLIWALALIIENYLESRRW
jgi:hypothetical protein